MVVKSLLLLLALVGLLAWIRTSYLQGWRRRLPSGDGHDSIYGGP